MTEADARTTANMLLAAAGMAAAYMILTRPPVRRLVFRMARLWLGASVPVYLANQAWEAWLESDRATKILARSTLTHGAGAKSFPS